MKGRFDVDPSLLSLDETLKDHNPYMVITVSSTGLNGHLNGFTDHRPTRVFVQEYTYNEETKEYTEGLKFDRMVKCTPESLRQATINKPVYDVFKQGGVDEAAYTKGEGVSDVEDFKRDFEGFISSHAENTKYIINNTSFCIDMLDKIGCADELKRQMKSHSVLDQPMLTKSYFAEHKINMQATLENLNNYINLTNDDAKIEGIDNRAKVISDFIQRRGREKGLLASEIDVISKKTELSYHTDLSDKGKSDYRNANIESKLQMLEKKGNISVDVLKRDYDCDLNRLYDILEGKNGVKGVVIMQCATTGFKAGDAPIQFTALQCDLENGKLQPKSFRSFDIQCDGRSYRQAIQAKEAFGKDHFDAFEFTGINLEAYNSGYATDKNGNIDKNHKLKSDDEALVSLNNFFNKFNINEYPIITNGAAGSAHPNQSYTQMALTHLGNLPVVNAPYIDFSEIVKQYSFVSYYDRNKYGQNVLFDIDKWEGETFSLNDIAKYRGQDIKHTQLKCAFMGNLLNDIAEQYSLIINQQEHNLSELSSPQPAPKTNGEEKVNNINPQPQNTAAIPSVTRPVRSQAEAVEQLPSHKERAVVTYTVDVAKEKGKEALQDWRVSQRENRVCAQSIADEIQKNKKGSAIDYKSALEAIENTYPQKRIDCVLAHEIFRSEEELNRPVYWDRRIDKPVQEWAKKILKAEEGFDFSSFQYCDIASKTNTSIINDLISQYIGVEKEKEVERQQTQERIRRHTAPVRTSLSDRHRTPTFKDEDYQGEYEGVYKSNEEAFISEGYDNIVEGIDNIPEKTDLERRAIREAEQAEWDLIKENIDGDYEEREVFKANVPKPEKHQNNLPERPPSDEKPYTNSDITALVKAFTDQTNAIREQTAVMQEQFNSVLKIVNLQAQALTLTVEALVDKSQGRETEKAETAIERLANVKDQISDVYSQISNRTAKGLLQNANDLISKGQNQLEEIDEPNKSDRNTA